jgi:hypothetical protein
MVGEGAGARYGRPLDLPLQISYRLTDTLVLYPPSFVGGRD